MAEVVLETTAMASEQACKAINDEDPCPTTPVRIKRTVFVDTPPVEDLIACDFNVKWGGGTPPPLGFEKGWHYREHARKNISN